MGIRVGYNEVNRKQTVRGVSVKGISNLQTIEKKIKKLTKVAKENILNTMEILSNKALDIKIFQISPKLFALSNYPDLEYFRYIDKLKGELEELGNIIKERNIRISIFPSSMIIMNSISEKVCEDSIKELKYQNDILEYMGLDERAKIVVNMEGGLWEKHDSEERLKATLDILDEKIKKRLVFTNGSEIVNIDNLIRVCEDFRIPFLLNTDSVSDIKPIEKSLKSWENTSLPALIYAGEKDNVNLIEEEAEKIGCDLDIILLQRPT